MMKQEYWKFEFQEKLFSSLLDLINLIQNWYIIRKLELQYLLYIVFALKINNLRVVLNLEEISNTSYNTFEIQEMNNIW